MNWCSNNKEIRENSPGHNRNLKNSVCRNETPTPATHKMNSQPIADHVTPCCYLTSNLSIADKISLTSIYFSLRL